MQDNDTRTEGGKTSDMLNSKCRAEVPSGMEPLRVALRGISLSKNEKEEKVAPQPRSNTRDGAFVLVLMALCKDGDKRFPQAKLRGVMKYGRTDSTSWFCRCLSNNKNPGSPQVADLTPLCVSVCAGCESPPPTPPPFPVYTVAGVSRDWLISH